MFATTLWIHTGLPPVAGVTHTILAGSFGIISHLLFFTCVFGYVYSFYGWDILLSNIYIYIDIYIYINENLH